MGDVIATFEWPNENQNVEGISDCFSWVTDQYIEFESAANLLREQNGVRERFNPAEILAEHDHEIMETMPNRTHQWLEVRVEVQAQTFEEYTSALQENGTNKKPIGNAGTDYYEYVQDLNATMA